MGHGHQHGPVAAVTAGGRYRKRLAGVLAITASVLVVQLVAALASGSLALLADATHMLTDSAGVALALVATVLAQRPASVRRTFGWQRIEVLAAAANGVLLIAVAVYVVLEALARFGDPVEVDAPVMLVAAVAGLGANAVSLLLLRGGQQESLNVRGAYLEVLGDLVGSVLVIAAAVVVWTTGFTRADAVASLLIAALIAPRAWALLRDALHVLMQGAPDDVDLDLVRRHMLDVPGVVDVHDLHAWTLTSGAPVLSAHVVIDEASAGPDAAVGNCAGRDLQQAGCTDLLDRLNHCLASDFDVEHSTLQLEPAGHRDHEGHTHD